MAENTNDEVKDKIEEMLVSDFNFDQSKAREVIDSTWTNTPENMIIKLTADVPLLFQRLKNESVKVSIGKITCIIFYRKTFNNAAFFTDSCLHLRFTRMYPRIPRENETGFIFRYDGVWR